MSDPNIDAADTHCSIQEHRFADYMEGYNAWEDGKTYTWCPYGDDQPTRRCDWQHGWREAENDFRMQGDCVLGKPESSLKEAD